MIPIVGVLLLGILGGYFIAAGRISTQVPPGKQRVHLALFVIGLGIIYVALIPAPEIFGPLNRFTVNMGQMLLAIDIAPILILLGTPRNLLQPPSRFVPDRRIFSPILTGIIASVILFGWMTPRLFEASSSSLTVWIIKQAAYLLAGFLIWFPVASPVEQWRAGYPAQILYLFLLRVPMAIIGVIFAFSENLIYQSRSFASEICAPSSLADQQSGGLVMWVAGGFFMLFVFTFIFYRWYRAQGRQKIDSHL